MAGTVASIAQFFGPVGQTVAAVAGAVSAVASVGAQLLAKDPPSLRSITDTLVALNPPQPYLVGRTYFGGVIRHEIGYGQPIGEIPNPRYFRASVFGGGGPYEALEATCVDYKPVAFADIVAQGYYRDYMFRDFQLGACPEAAQVAANFTTPIPGWGASAKLSGQAAIGFQLVLGEEKEHYSSGTPALGAIWLGAKCYDMRKDGSLPNGSGAHRQFVETTYQFSKNPAVQAVTYAMGRVQNGKLTLGVGIGFKDVVIDGIGPVEGIWWDDWAAFANVCDANGWEGGGVVFEGEGAPPRWDNLKDLCAAGGGIPVVTGGKLGVVWQAPRVAVDVIKAEDLTDAPVRIPSTKSIFERVNAATPKFASEEHDWDFVPGDRIVIDEYVAEDDGEERDMGEVQFNLVNNAKQAAELMTYKLARQRERGPIQIPCGPRMRRYRIGTCLECADDMGEYGLAGEKVVVLDRTIDFDTMTVTLTVETENDAKHALALGQTGGSPPVYERATAEERDAVAAAAGRPAGYVQQLISTSSQTSVTVTATDTAITIGDHSRIYSDKTVPVTGATITTENDGATPIAAEMRYYLYYDDAERSGGAVNWKATRTFFVAQTSGDTPRRHYSGYITTDVAGGNGTTGGGSLPAGSGGSDPYQDPGTGAATP